MAETDLITDQVAHFHLYLERDPADHACCMDWPLADLGEAVNELLDHRVVGIGDKLVVEFLPAYSPESAEG